MGRYVLDTNMAVGCARGSTYWSYAVEKLDLLDSQKNLSFCSVVTKGEILSLARRLNWGEARLGTLGELFAKLPIVPITPQILQSYAEIDAFSISSGRRMESKNDIWIAATAHAGKAALITTDGDFDHLNGQFITVIKIDPKMK